ncbi:DNA-directed RNA polymerase III subunit C34 [Ceratobasidium theobromae]|uniref:DNA-directed RNA polymerase III subunit C34 n=1 Tax=Ceratobasidium theobromae TaxID=1582974 RepID=A0A5N5QQB6_9AGAM|nr:DNA-directed RNA polymerase III subunit C34 [Ceratobasidium theobromae]
MSTLTPGELEVYEACSQAEDGMLRQKELEKRITIKGADMAAAVNGLLKKSLLKIMKDGKGILSYKAVDKADAKIVGLMDADESIVYKKIQEAKNEGIWTKHLKSTELHQSVITRVLKSLEKKGLIKSIKSHPTRKIYILANLQPSIEVSGGPWYNNSEFETEFVQTLCNACLNFIQKRSYPVQKSNSKLSPRALFPTSQSSRYPTAADVLNFLKQTNITDTPLEISHVESLLQVLIYDGSVEALPGSGIGGMPDLNGKDDNSDSDSDDESSNESRKKKRRKKDKGKSSNNSNGGSTKRGKKRIRDDSRSDSATSDDDSDSNTTASRKKKRRKEANSDSDADSDSDSDLDSGSADDDAKSDSDARFKKRKKSARSKSESRSKSRSKSRRTANSDSDSNSEPGSDPDSSSDSDSSGRGRNKSKSKKSAASKPKSKSKAKSGAKVKREVSPEEVQFDANAGRVYRAIRPERVAQGWTQSPCSVCPQFDFCHDDGPVNAQECQYYSTWLNAGVADAE